MAVIVTILISGNEPNEAERALASLFENPLFEVYFLGGDDDASFIRALRNSTSEEYTIIIRGTSVSSSTSEFVAEVIGRVLSSPNSVGVTPKSRQAPQWHLCYLCRWEDRCDLYQNNPIERVGDSTTSIVQTLSPNGTQAILFSPAGREMVLGMRKMENGGLFDASNGLDASLKRAIFNHDLVARCIVPNLFEFNILLGRDYYKTIDCLPQGSGGLSDLAGELPAQLAALNEQEKLSPWVFIVPIGLIFLGIILCVFIRKS